MQSSYLKMRGKWVHDEYSHAVLGVLTSVFISRDSGKILYLSFVSDEKKDLVYVLGGDVIRVLSGEVLIRDRNVVQIRLDEEVVKEGVDILLWKVVDVEGNYLGRVVDLDLDFGFGVLSNITVRKNKFVFFRDVERIFTFGQIISMSSGEIVVEAGNAVRMENENLASEKA